MCAAWSRPLDLWAFALLPALYLRLRLLLTRTRGRWIYYIPSSAVSVSSITSSTSYLYAHGDRRTSQRLRTHIQQGHQIVMLYNSGGITQIFSWLQRVMAHSSSPPSIVRMRDPIELLLSAVPAARGMVGVPESEFARPQTL